MSYHIIGLIHLSYGLMGPEAHLWSLVSRDRAAECGVVTGQKFVDSVRGNEAKSCFGKWFHTHVQLLDSLKPNT